MTDTQTQKSNNLQEKSQQVLKNISQLQTQEKTLYNKLNDVSLTAEQKQQIINQINEIAQMRINIYSSMKDMYSHYRDNVNATQTTLEQEVVAIDVLEHELNQSKVRLNKLEDEKNNKLRLVEINTYYGKRYNAHARLMKIIALTCVPIIIFVSLNNYGLLPSNIYAFLTGLTIIIGIVLVCLELIDMSNRDAMNWDEYNWYFNKNDAPTNTNTNDTSSYNPWAISNNAGTCVGSACCYEGSTYDEDLNVCVLNKNTNNNNNNNTIENFSSLEKYGYSQGKSVAYNGKVRPSQTELYKKQY